MSKSLRNAVEPLGIARAFGRVVGSDAGGADVLRYQLLRAIAFGQDGDFDLAAMIERYNADLGKNLGNLLARTLGLCAKMTAAVRCPRRGSGRRSSRSFTRRSRVTGARRSRRGTRLEPHRALERTWAIASAANQYVDRAAPWAEEKKGNHARVETILSTLLSVLGALSVAIWPVLPAKSDEMRRQLGPRPGSPRGGQGLARRRRRASPRRSARSPRVRRSSRRSTRPARRPSSPSSPPTWRRAAAPAIRARVRACIRARVRARARARACVRARARACVRAHLRPVRGRRPPRRPRADLRARPQEGQAPQARGRRRRGRAAHHRRGTRPLVSAGGARRAQGHRRREPRAARVRQGPRLARDAPRDRARARS